MTRMSRKEAKQLEEKEMDKDIDKNIDSEATEEAVSEADDVKEEQNVEEEQNAEEQTDRKEDKKDAQIAELTDRYKRLLAEFDNYRKRTEKEKSAMYEVGVKDTLEKILPIVDNFERGLATVSEENKEDAFVVGIDKTYRQLTTTLENMGVVAIDTFEKEFDPNIHNAVMHVDDENYGENAIVEEFQKGYMYKESVLRHSMVKVAN